MGDCLATEPIIDVVEEVLESVGTPDRPPDEHHQTKRRNSDFGLREDMGSETGTGLDSPDCLETPKPYHC